MNHPVLIAIKMSVDPHPAVLEVMGGGCDPTLCPLTGDATELLALWFFSTGSRKAD